MIRHIVILQFEKRHGKDFKQLLEETRPYLAQIPGIVKLSIYQNDSNYVPEGVCSFGVEILFKDMKALDLFMQHPKHFEANAVFEQYLADLPYMVLTHEV